jgi:tRNA threonylcarbamoyl adenosine modification protein YeaZ
MMLLLHTSSVRARLGLADHDQLIAQDTFLIDRQLAEKLAERIPQFLQATHCTLPALTHIVVHSGPGGFTGLRIGVTTANALAYALGIPVVGISGLVKDLTVLLDRSRTEHPSIGSIAIPVYARPPDIGPVPGSEVREAF